MLTISPDVGDLMTLVRVASAADFEQILPLAHRFFESSQYGAIMAFDADSFARTYEQLINGAGVVLVAELDGAIVGMAGALAYPFYFNAAHKTGQELFWWVNEEARGGGAGAQLFKAMEEWAKGQGCKTFSMIALESLKPEAVGAMYRRSGYRASEHTYIKEL